MGIPGSYNIGTVPYFWPYFAGIFPYIDLMALYMVGISNQSVPVAWPLIMGDHKAQSTQTTTSPQQTIFKRLGSIENTRRNMVIYPFTIRYSEKM